VDEYSAPSGVDGQLPLSVADLALGAGAPLSTLPSRRLDLDSRDVHLKMVDSHAQPVMHAGPDPTASRDRPAFQLPSKLSSGAQLSVNPHLANASSSLRSGPKVARAGPVYLRLESVFPSRHVESLSSSLSPVYGTQGA